MLSDLALGELTKLEPLDIIELGGRWLASRSASSSLRVQSERNNKSIEPCVG